MRKLSSIILLLLASACAANAQQLWNGIIAPSRAIDWTKAGVQGGIPSATWTQCGSTLAAGASNATIQSAINACTPGSLPANGKFVLLAAGSYNNLTGINMKTGVVLRGAGGGQTILNFTDKGSCGAICFQASDNTFPAASQVQPGGAQAANWASGFTQGTTQIVLNNIGSNGLSVGKWVVLDQANLTSKTGEYYVCDTTSSPFCSLEGANGPRQIGGLFHSQMQFVQITACSPSCTNGATFTITPGLYGPNWNSALAPGVWWAASPIQWSGVEDLKIDDSGDSSQGPNNIGFYNAINSWVRGVTSVKPWRAHAQFGQAVHCEVRDSYLYDTKNAASQSYGIESYMGSDNLVINNIAQRVGSPWMNQISSGTAFLYNFDVLDYYCSQGAGVACNDSASDTRNTMGQTTMMHDAGVMYALWEGNITPGMKGDAFHGSGGLQTFFRNYVAGWAPFVGTRGTTSFTLEPGNHGYNLYGNVLGKPGFSTSYVNGGNGQIYDLGQSHGNGTVTVPADSGVASTLYRWDNYDTVNAATRCVASEVPSALVTYQQPVPSSCAAPNSLYYSVTPSWWPAGKPWPLLGPEVVNGNVGRCVGGTYDNSLVTSSTQCPGGTMGSANLGGRLNSNPAMDCYFQMGGPPDGTGLILNFNAANCYQGGGGSGSPSVLLSTTLVTFGNQLVSTQSSLTTFTVTNNGTAALSINSVNLSGTNPSEFVLVNGCGSTLAVNAACNIQVRFTPLTTGAKSAAVTIADNASGSPHSVSLTGTGTQPIAQYAPTSLTFASQTLSTTSAAQAVVLTNNGTAALTLTSFAINGDFLQTNNCPVSPSTIAVGGSCAIQVTFTPSIVGTRTGTLTVTSNSSGSPQAVPLSGTGQASASCGVVLSVTGVTLSGGGITLSCPFSFNFGTSLNPFINNTSACSAADASCTQAFTGITTTASNAGVITTITDPAPANTNVSDITKLMYAGANPKVVFHFQDWWGCSGHMNIGQVGNNPTLIARQAAMMLAYNGYGLVIDWAGNIDSGKSCRLAVTNAWASYLTTNFSGPSSLHMSIMLDGGGLSSSCPTGATDQTSCLSTALNSENDYVNTNYSTQAWYMLDGGRPMVFYFIDESSWSGTNWTTVWSNVKTHTNAYANPPKFLFENSQTHTQGDGGYAWNADPQIYTATKQLWWGSTTGTTPTSYSNFYASCLSHPSNVCVGMIKKGFDDGIGFGGGFTGRNRVQSQRCAQTTIDTANLIGSSGFSSATQLAYVGLGINDYEEGTAMEMGVDNCYSVSASIVGTTLSWTITALDGTYSTLTTVDHLQIIYGSGTSFNVVSGASNITPVLSGSASIANVPPGSWTIYVQMIGKPTIMNHLSNAIAYSS